MSFRPTTELRNQRYEIISTLGGGAYGKVYEVEDRRDGDRKALKAIKIFDPRSGQPDKTAANEVRILTKLRNAAGIPTIFDDFIYRGCRCIVQQMGIGDLDKLRSRNRNCSLSNETTARVAYHLTGILKTLHAHGILHRDVKAGNVMLTMPGSSDHMKLIDFGISTIFSHSAPMRSRRTRIERGGIEFQLCPYAAPVLCRHETPQEKEDLIMMLYLLITLSNQWPFNGTPNQMLAAKIDFETRPDRYLIPSQMYLLPIIRCVCAQIHGKTPKYGQIQAEICRSVHRFNPYAPFKVSRNSQGQWTLK